MAQNPFHTFLQTSFQIFPDGQPAKNRGPFFRSIKNRVQKFRKIPAYFFQIFICNHKSIENSRFLKLCFQSCRSFRIHSFGKFYCFIKRQHRNSRFFQSCSGVFSRFIPFRLQIFQILIIRQLFFCLFQKLCLLLLFLFFFIFQIQ